MNSQLLIEIIFIGLYAIPISAFAAFVGSGQFQYANAEEGESFEKPSKLKIIMTFLLFLIFVYAASFAYKEMAHSLNELTNRAFK